MIVYWDTSALVAVYVRDVCTRQALRVFAATTKPVSSWLCFAETHAALRAVRDARRISEGDYVVALKEFEADWSMFHRIPVKATIAPELRRLFKFHGLRGADATHLASALVMNHRLMATNQHVVFACHDSSLARAAEAEGLGLAWPIES